MYQFIIIYGDYLNGGFLMPGVTSGQNLPSINEEKAREMLTNCIQNWRDAGIHPLAFLRELEKAIPGHLPRLTDRECQAIATNFPFYWQDIRTTFPPSKAQLGGRA